MSKKLTMMYAYYDNPMMLEHQQLIWVRYPERLKSKLVIRIVDDCSPRWPAVDSIMAGDPGYELHLYRVGVDVPWNMDHARNLMADQSDTTYLFMSDMDHVLPVDSFCALFDFMGSGRPREDEFFTFARVDAPDLTPYKYHPNTYLMRRDLYWQVGGYDEEFAGFYGTDGHFRRGLLHVGACETRLHDVPIVRYPREVIADASTTTLERKKGRDMARAKQIRAIAARKRKEGIRPTVLTFPWKKVL